MLQEFGLIWEMEPLKVVSVTYSSQKYGYEKREVDGVEYGKE